MDKGLEWQLHAPPRSLEDKGSRKTASFEIRGYLEKWRGVMIVQENQGNESILGLNKVDGDPSRPCEPNIG